MLEGADLACLVSARHDAAEVQRRHLWIGNEVLAGTGMELGVESAYGFPSLSRTTPFGSLVSPLSSCFSFCPCGCGCWVCEVLSASAIALLRAGL